MTSAILVGPGRAGLSVTLAMQRAGHEIVCVVARDATAGEAAAAMLGTSAVDWGSRLPSADIVILGVRDDAISEVAAATSAAASDVGSAVHLSGMAGLDVLRPLGAVGLGVGSFHPLQSLPEPELGAARLDGAWIAIDADSDPLRAALRELAASIGATPFDVDPEARSLYHAAAAAAANFPLAALAMAEDLFGAAGVPFEAAKPLVETVVENAFAIGARSALTGPVARGDVGTVSSQLEAVRRYGPEWEEAFRSFVAVLADMTDQKMDL
ncbi:MAG: DUF2520 domain-containing protein [Acidimicrobiia bacterium]|nr:DUF2520 domain-containing protein [Acidimicrobiia bacterium]